MGGSGSNGTASERTNKQVVEAICGALDGLLPAGAPHSQLITPVSDRPDHDRRYAIDPARISTELGWQQRHSFEEGLAATVLLVSGAAGLVPVGAPAGRLQRGPAGGAGGRSETRSGLKECCREYPTGQELSVRSANTR